MARQKYNLQKDFFDVIDTEDKAYWLGFLYADGCNMPHRREIKLRLAIKDEAHLLKLRNALYPDRDRPLYYQKRHDGYGYHESCELYISNTHMSKSLEKLGCIANKTFQALFPFEAMPETLYHHFIRGVFDGDGSISLSTLKSGEHKTMFSIIGNRPFMAEINHIMAQACELGENQLIAYKGKDERIATLSWSGCRQCIKIREYLYQDATIYLERKWEKFQKLGTDEWRTYNNMRKPQIETPPYNPHQRRGRSGHNTLLPLSDTTSALVIKDQYALVDTADIAKIDQYTWHIENGRVVTAQRVLGQNKTTVMYLSRIVTDALPGQSVKHIDNNPLNCCRNNLKVRNHR